MPTYECDVVVTGAGPAGFAAATSPPAYDIDAAEIR